MGWIGLDFFLVYFYRASIRLVGFFKSRKWDRVVASLTDWTVSEPGRACLSLKVRYEFMVNGHLVVGCDEFSFISAWHTSSYAQSLSRGLPSIIRVNPRNPHETRYFDHDQVPQAEMELPEWLRSHAAHGGERQRD